jgi:hypothetical protein
MDQNAEGKRFGQMSGGERVAFFGKVIVFLFTMGFAFPTVLHSDDYTKRFQ